MNPEILAFSIVILLFSVIVHEVMHGFVALQFGDHTAENAGRLTLNPIPHIDLVGTILLPALLILSGSPIFFGWAKPVPVNPLHFRDIRRGEFFVSIAGIGANVALALLAAVLYHILNQFYPQPILLQLLLVTTYLNLILALFNLIPIPPLDGSKVLLSQLPLNLARSYQQLDRFGYIILIALMLVKVGSASILSIYLGTAITLIWSIILPGAPTP